MPFATSSPGATLLPHAFDRLVYNVDPWVMSLAAILLLLLLAESGYRLGLRRRAVIGEGARGQITTLQAAILGFLALVLGFTFSISQGRFDTRRQLVVAEANAIGTTYLRSLMLPEPHRQQFARLLTEYADIRLPADDVAAIERSVVRAEQLHDELWAEAITASHTEPNPAVTLLFTQTLNEMIDLHTMRVAAYLYRAPGMLIVLLHVTAALAVGVMGYASGLDGRRNIGAMAVMVALVAIVLLLIVDLEQPRAGMIQTSQRALIEVRDELHQVTQGAADSDATSPD